MKDDWLNKNLENKLGDYDSPMDIENAWEALQTKRQAPKKNNKFFFFWIIFGLLATGIGGSYFFSNNLFNNYHNNTITKADNILKTENQVVKNLESPASTLSDFKNINQQNAKINKSTETKTIFNISKNINFENQNYPTQKETESIVNINTPFSKSRNNNNNNNNINTSKVNLDFVKKANSNSIFPKQKKLENIIVIDSTISSKATQPIAVLFLPSLKIELLDVSQKVHIENINISFSKIHRTYPPAPVPPNYFGVVAGYGIRSKGKVSSQENALDVISINAFYEKRLFINRLYFKTGISFDQLVNSIETTTEQPFTQLLDDQLIAVNHFQNGSIEDVFGTAKVSMIEKANSKSYNRYRLISIPLILGYDLVAAKRISLQVEGGIARSIFGNHSGKYFDLIDSDFRKQGVWQGLYGLNFNFKTNSRTNIFTSLKGNYHLNKIGKSEQLEMEKFRFHQIQIGVRFKL